MTQADRDDNSRRSGQTLLTQISNEIVRIHKETHGKGPEQAKAYMLDDFLIVVMRGSILPVEQTMLDAGHEGAVRDFRQAYENVMAERLTDRIEGLTGRNVLTYQSQILFEPPIVVEMFFFDDKAPAAEREATAEDQSVDATASEATGGGPID